MAMMCEECKCTIDKYTQACENGCECCNLPKTTFYSECECGATVEGAGQYDPQDGTLYADEVCKGCGEEFTVSGWFDECEECDLFHGEGEC